MRTISSTQPSTACAEAHANQRLHRNELIALLAPSLGQDKAAQLVVEASAELGLSTFEYSLEDASLVLSQLSQVPGLTGITALLARSRLTRLFAKAAG